MNKKFSIWEIIFFLAGLFGYFAFVSMGKGDSLIDLIWYIMGVIVIGILCGISMVNFYKKMEEEKQDDKIKNNE